MNFIEQYTIENDVICDELVRFFHTADKFQGINGGGFVDTSYKKSTDAMVTPEAFKPYSTILQSFVDQYIQKYEHCNTGSAWCITQPPNIQHYAPGEGFYGWHNERPHGFDPFARRHLVFMTYLNTIEEDGFGGGTEWLYQQHKTKAVKGHTLIWPVDWTHTHRGIISNTSHKYIITGWFNYLQ